MAVAKINTASPEETTALGRKFSSLLEEKDLILLEGDLGGGKTTFVKGVVRGLNLRSRVLSPSFTLARHYPGKKLSVHHIDLYRLDDYPDFIGIGIEEYLYSQQAVTFIEWGEKIEPSLDRYIKAAFFYTGAASRQVTFSLRGYGKDKARQLKEAVTG